MIECEKASRGASFHNPRARRYKRATFHEFFHQFCGARHRLLPPCRGFHRRRPADPAAARHRREQTVLHRLPTNQPTARPGQRNMVHYQHDLYTNVETVFTKGGKAAGQAPEKYRGRRCDICDKFITTVSVSERRRR